MSSRYRGVALTILLCIVCGVQSHAKMAVFGTHREKSESFLRSVAKGWIRFFQKFISPYDGRKCGLYPTCSEYSRQCFMRYGFPKGWLMTADRLQRCHPKKTVGFYRYRSGRIVDTPAENAGSRKVAYDLFSDHWIDETERKRR